MLSQTVGFNMENGFAIFVTYAAHLVDGNLITDLLSIGRKSVKTGPDPPYPAKAGGLNTHALFEGKHKRNTRNIEAAYTFLGDASLTRNDAFFGDNHSFNDTLFKQVFTLQFHGKTQLKFLILSILARSLQQQIWGRKI